MIPGTASDIESNLNQESDCLYVYTCFASNADSYSGSEIVIICLVCSQINFAWTFDLTEIALTCHA